MNKRFMIWRKSDILTGGKTLLDGKRRNKAWGGGSIVRERK